MDIHHYDSPKSSMLFAAQQRSYKSKNLTKIVKNPFIPKVQNLEKDTCSPSLFVIGQSPSANGEFSWSIDEISRIQPADIESPQYLTVEYDEKAESQAQEAIEKYFSQTNSLVSPINHSIGTWHSPAVSTPRDNSGHSVNRTPAVSSTPCIKGDRRTVIKTDACVMTDLSLPPVLPPEVEAILKPYFRVDNGEPEEANLNNSTLRRKLFFNDKKEPLSPVNSPPCDPIDRTSWFDWNGRDESSIKNQPPPSPDLSPIKSNCNSLSDSSFCSFPEPLDITANYELDNEQDAMAVSLDEIVEQRQIIFSSTQMLPKANSIDGQQDTGYSTTEDTSIKKDKVFNSTSIISEN